jgi:signal transduction histidine kinase
LDPGYVITESDTGSDLPDDAREKIFRRFVRVDKARSRSAPGQSGGAGLGLAIARSIAGVHPGSVVVRSSSRQGSVFTVALPWSDAGLPAATAAKESTPRVV